MNGPAVCRAVMARSKRINRFRATAVQVASETRALVSPDGRLTMRSAKIAMATPPRRAKVTRQPKWAATVVTIGSPTATASDQPRKTKAIAPDLSLSGTISATVLAACGV